MSHFQHHHLPLLVFVAIGLGCSSSSPEPKGPDDSPECATLGAECPETCQSVGGWLIDTDKLCRGDMVVWGCASPDASFAGVLQCSVSSDGVVYVSGIGQRHPDSRDCTDDEAARYTDLELCQP